MRAVRARAASVRPVPTRAASVMSPRLLACDLDGTLLDEAGFLHPSVGTAIGAVRDAGVEVVLATGRSPWAVAEYSRLLGLTRPQIVMNGGAYVSPVSGEVIWARRLSSDLVVEGLAFAAGLGSPALLSFLDHHTCSRNALQSGAVPDFAVGLRLEAVDSLVDLAGSGPIRICISTAPREHAQAVAEATEWFGGRASIVFSEDSCFEVMAPGTNKGQALRTVAAAMQIDRRRVAAIGNGPNDREMLAYAGRSAALLPPSGSPVMRGSVLGDATEVVPSVDRDGAVEAIRRFFPRLDLSASFSSGQAVAGGSTSARWMDHTARSGSAGRRAQPPDWDDDPEPDLGLTAA